MTRLGIEAIAGALLLAAILIGITVYNNHERTLGAANAVAKQTAKDLAASIANQAVTAQRVTDVQEKANVADQKASAARADADAARTAGDRLRSRLAALQRASAAHPATACASAPTGDTPSVVPYDVFERVRSAAGQFAAFADDLSVRLDACVGSYDALMPRP